MLSHEPMFRIDAELADILYLGATPYGDRQEISAEMMVPERKAGLPED